MASTSSTGYTAPVGFDGDTNMSAFVRSVTAASSCSTVDAEAGRLVGRQDHRHAAGERDRLGVGGPERRRQQHLVARVEQGGEGVVDGVLAAVGDEHLAGRRPGGRSRGGSCRRSPRLSSGSPPAGVYLWFCGSRQASTAASTMWAGVGKSGSPAPKPMTGSPAAFSAFALASTASVADSAIAAMRRETRASVRGVANVLAPWWTRPRSWHGDSRPSPRDQDPRRPPARRRAVRVRSLQDPARGRRRARPAPAPTTSAPPTARPGCSSRWGPCATASPSCSPSPTATRCCSATAAPPPSGTPPPSA